MKKKSQVQMGETIAVLFVFFIIIVIGLIFYTKVLKGNISTEKGEQSELRSISIVQKVMFLPEVQCSVNGIIQDNCIDILKINYVKNAMSQNQIFYYDLLEFSDIKIAQIFPSSKNWTLYSRPTDQFQNRYVTNIPISLYDPLARKFGFGIMEVTTYAK